MTVAGAAVRDLYTKVPYDDVLYSLATSNPGALVLHNYPNGLRKLHKKDTIFLDIAATDVLRDRERGVLALLRIPSPSGMRVPKSFADLTSNPDWQRELAAIYKSVEQVDLLVGLHCETAPPGFRFSDTAFRIFILMASRRLKSDRFFSPPISHPRSIRPPDLRGSRTTTCAACWSGTCRTCGRILPMCATCSFLDKER